MTDTLQRPPARFVDESLVEGYPSGVRLIGSQCNSCGTVTFPAQGSCPRCTATDVARTPLDTDGPLWAYTIQGFPPKTPYLAADAKFAPFGVGYVNLGDKVLVETRIVAPKGTKLEIGMPMSLVLDAFFTEADGTVVETFAFAPSNTANIAAAPTGSQS